MIAVVNITPPDVGFLLLQGDQTPPARLFRFARGRVPRGKRDDVAVASGCRATIATIGLRTTILYLDSGLP